MAIEGIPDEFVAGAVRRFIRGEVKRERHAFLPTAPEFAIEARKLRDEAAAARYVALPAPSKREETPAEAKVRREAVAKLFDGLARQMSAGPKRNHAVLTPEDELALLADAARHPVRVSSALLSKIGGQHDPQA